LGVFLLTFLGWGLFGAFKEGLGLKVGSLGFPIGRRGNYIFGGVWAGRLKIFWRGVIPRKMGGSCGKSVGFGG